MRNQKLCHSQICFCLRKGRTTYWHYRNQRHTDVTGQRAKYNDSGNSIGQEK